MLDPHDAMCLTGLMCTDFLMSGSWHFVQRMEMEWYIQSGLAVVAPSAAVA
jgi:hypothetical protein